MAGAHLLDRPIWNSLQSGWAHLAEGDGRALRIAQEFGPFGASSDTSPASLEALRQLIPAGGELWLVEAGEAAIPPRTSVTGRGVLHQMIAHTLKPGSREIEAVELGDDDAPEMQALADLTKPGPFRTLTHRLGDFVGVRHEGRLVAMAGERMRMCGLCEVSGVCTHPDHRGRGFAGSLMSLVAERIRARGETPFLHSYAHNASAIALYERLGFRYRATINLTKVAHAPAMTPTF